MSESIRIKDIFVILARYKLLLLLVPALLSLLFTAYSMSYMKRIYEAKASIYVMLKPFGDTESIQYNELLAAQAMIKDFKEYIRSPEILEALKNEFDLNMSDSELYNSISVTNKKETRIMDVSVAYTDSKMSAVLTNRLAEIFIKKAGVFTNLDSIFVMSKAKAPIKPSKPNVLLNMISSFFGGLLVSIFIVFLREYFYKYIRTADEMERILKVETIGIVSRIPFSLFKDGLKFSNHHMPKSIASEEIRELMLNILFYINEEYRVLLITSPDYREGKTTVAVSLAEVLSIRGLKVLLIDGDLRKPILHQFFGLKEIGYATWIQTGDSISKFIQTTQNRNLHVLCSGGKCDNPHEYLTPIKISEITEWAKQYYDVVLVDTPPVGHVTDACNFSKCVHGAIMVSKAMETERELLNKANTLFIRSGGKVIGGILNFCAKH